MSNIVNIKGHHKATEAEIENEAAAWVVQLHDAKPTAEDLKAFESWLQLSPQHRSVFESMAGTWLGADCLSDLAFPETEKSEVKESGSHWYDFRFANVVAGGVAACFIALLLNFWGGFLGPVESHIMQARYETAVGELEAVDLPDGTDMRLNTSSQTQVNYIKEARLIHLVKGEAHFEVHHDASKPFVVYAGKIAVRAVGTAFSVYLKDNDVVDVIVTDGEVKIASLPKTVTEFDEVSLELLDEAETVASFVEGQRAVFRDKIELVESMESQEIDRKLSWRDGMLIFDGDSLEYVIYEVSRYTSREIVILDTDIRAMKIGGYFRAGDIDPMLETLKTNFGLNVEEINENLIYLSLK